MQSFPEVQYVVELEMKLRDINPNKFQDSIKMIGRESLNSSYIQGYSSS